MVISIAWFAKKSEPSKAFEANSTDYLDNCQVLSIIDGDTIITKCRNYKMRIRLQYIDAPELSQGSWGNKSKNTLKELAGKYVSLQLMGLDIYHRYLAVVFRGMLFSGKLADEKRVPINLTLVKVGMARVYARYHPPYRYLQAMKNAKRNERGIWATRGLQQDPARYRRLAY